MGQAKDEYGTMKEMMVEMNERLSLAERELAILRAMPVIHTCGSHSDDLSGSFMTIPYTSLLYSSTNTEGGGLDITTGVFTAPAGGTYTVSWDTSVVLTSGGGLWIYLQKNGETIQESELWSSFYNGVSNGHGHVYDQGGRTMVVYLAMGDTLQLYRGDGTGRIRSTTFCVSLTTPDIV